ncbi:MAG: glutathione S-transferase family protein [Pseudomonadota bacterium]
MLIIYEHPLSPYAQKVKIALREKQVPFELRFPEGIGAGATEGAFASASLRGEVPALIHDGFAVHDSSIMLDYIEDVWPEPPMLPAFPKDRARVRMLEDYMDTWVEAISWGLGELVFFKRGTPDVRDAMMNKVGDQLFEVYTYLEAQLGDRSWFNGDSFGWGDLSAVPFINGVAGFGFRPPEGSAVAAWFERINQRESVAQTRNESAASMTGMELVAEAVEQKLFKRQYRDHRLEWMLKTGGRDIILDGMDQGTIRFTGPGATDTVD